MSAEMSPSVPENAQNGVQDGSGKKSKKRRREEEQAQNGDAKTAAEPESTPAKKQKKSKKDKETAVKFEVAVESEPAVAELPAAKKEKKKKRKHVEAPENEAEIVEAKPAEETEAGAAETSATEPAKKPKNPRKRKDRPQDVPETNGDVDEKPAVAAIVGSPETSKKSKKKKERKTSPPTVNGETDGVELPASIIPDPQPAVAPQTNTAIDEKLLSTKSPFIRQTTSFYLALSPIAHHFALEGLCAEHISPLLLTYYSPLKGVVLSYSNPRMSESPEQGAQVRESKEVKTILSQSIDEYAVTYVWLTADFVVFRPRKNTVLEGHVNLQNESILGLICYNYFNAGIERSRLPKDWCWVADESGEESGGSRAGRRDAAGHFVNAKGEKIEGRIVFKVKDFEAAPGAENGSGSINIYGTLLGEAEDAKMDEETRQKGFVRDRPARR